MGTAWRQAEALGLLGAYQDIAFDHRERWQLEGGKRIVMLHLRLGEWQHLLVYVWYLAACREGGGGEKQRGHSVATS